MDEDYIPDDVRVWIINNAIDVADMLIWLHANPGMCQLITNAAIQEKKREALRTAVEN